MIASVLATRYVQPLREGGSLPAVVEDEEGGLWVVKFRGAGQGARALLAELLAGELARAAGLPVPELSLVEVPEAFGRTEPDPEIQDVLRASRGVNVGMRYLDGAFNFDFVAAGDLVDPDQAADVVWLDAFLTNPDRSHRNPNLLVWREGLWLIDHGAALYAHHNWSRVDRARTRAAFPGIERHVLVGHASSLREADRRLIDRVRDPALEGVLESLPDVLLTDPVSVGEGADAERERRRYRDYLTTRLGEPREWVDAAERARRAAAAAPRPRKESRR
ncbi:MAG TPA: HipA family kinase [Longimicrobiales bacterium]|nr:HipA family kinase [Longimicrobiales bacterium]